MPSPQGRVEMTPFEAQSIAIAQQGLVMYFWADAIATVALVVSVVGGILIFGQLQSTKWNSLLSFEQDMQNRRQAFTTISEQIGSGSPPSNLAAIYKSEKEGYLNSVDRLASSILNGQFPHKEMKQDYRDYISNVVTNFASDFAAGTKYRKTLKLYEKWQD
jgi:hypothetical protein